LNILFLGDIVGKPGREILNMVLPGLSEERKIDFVIANGENMAGGKGVTREVADDLFKEGVNVLTGGNHTWQNRDSYSFIEEEGRLLRPANYPEGPGIPGRGFGVFKSKLGYPVGVISLQGRIFMSPIDCPFQKVKGIVERMRLQTFIILVDFHAEATSEKIAMGWFLDGSVSAVIGTHTHVPTADEKILPKGTAYITDAGMTGSHNGVIGVRRELVIEGMLTRLPVRHKLSTGDLMLNGVLISIDPGSGKALSIERIHRLFPREEDQEPENHAV